MADENRNKNWGENQNTKPTLRMPGLFRNIDRARLMKGELGSLYSRTFSPHFPVLSIVVLQTELSCSPI